MSLLFQCLELVEKLIGFAPQLCDLLDSLVRHPQDLVVRAQAVHLVKTHP